MKTSAPSSCFLAAIKLVFEDKKLTMDQLIDALEANFEGYEDIQPSARLPATATTTNTPTKSAANSTAWPSFAAKYGKEMGINNDAQRALHLSRALR